MAEESEELPAQAPTHDPVTGAFLPGNKVAKSRGNPYMKEIQRFRSVVYKQIRDGDIEEITASLIRQAKKDDSLGLKAKNLLYEITGVKVKQVEAKVESDGNVKLYLGIDTDKV